MAAHSISANTFILSYGTFLFPIIFVHLSNNGGILAAPFKYSGHFPLQTSLHSGENSNLKLFRASSPLRINKNKYHRRSVKTVNNLGFPIDYANGQYLTQQQYQRDSNVKEHIMDTSIHKEEETDSLDHLLEVMGPHLFLVPFALQTLPFAIPAIPISYLLSRYEPAEIGEHLREMLLHLNEMMKLKPHADGNATVIHDHVER